MIRDLAATDPTKADELARTAQPAVRELVRGEVGTLVGVDADGWALVILNGKPHNFPFGQLADEPDDGLVRLEMWELIDGRPETDPRLLGNSTCITI